MSSARVPGKWRAAAVYTALTLLLSYPISLRPDRVVWADDPETHLVMWLLAWDSHALLHQPLSIFDANTFYPNRRTLAYQENLIGSALFAAPVMWLTSNPVLAVNVVSMLACVLCGLGAYVLARRVGIGGPGALLCGVIFAFAPPRFLRFPQTHLAAVQWVPFALASLHAYLEGGRKRDLRLATAFFTFQVMTSGHGGVFAAVAIALMLAYRLALGEPMLFVQRLRDFGFAGAVLLVPAVLFVIPYRINQSEMGLRRSLDGWDTPLENFFASPTPVDVFLQSLITNSDINGIATAWLFPGVLPILLALVAVVPGGITLARRARLPSTAERSALKADLTPGSASTAYARATAVLRRVARRRKADPTPAAAGWKARFRRPVLCLVSAVLAWALLGVVRPIFRAGDGLSARYFDNPQWADPPVSSAIDPQPSTAQMMERWSGRPPAAFSVVWTGYISVVRPGLYYFITPPGGLRIDDRVAVDDGGRGGVHLDRGPHRLVLQYAQPGRAAPLEWLWARAGDAEYEPVPRWAMSRQPVGYRSVLAVRSVDAARWSAAILVVLAATWCVLAWPVARVQSFEPYRRNPTAFYALLTGVCVALALGPPYGLWQYVYWLPGLNFIRGPSRFMVLGLLGFAVLAGIGFERLSVRLAPSSRRVFAGIVVALLAIEFAGQTFSTAYRFEIPAPDRWVARQPKPFVVAEVPSSSFQRSQTTYMLHSMAHWQKTVHGYGAILPDLHRRLHRELETFPDTPSLQHLAQLDVTYVIVHTDMYSSEQWTEVDQRLRSFSEWLTLEYSDPTGRVYALRRPAASVRAAEHGGGGG